jgi:hypothetical protein
MSVDQPVETPRDSVRVRAAWYVALAAATVAFVAYNFRLHQADLTVPLCPVHSDSAALLSLVTAINESGWPWHVERVGAPGVAERYDYPLPEHAHYLTIRALVRLTDQPFHVFHFSTPRRDGRSCSWRSWP